MKILIPWFRPDIGNDELKEVKNSFNSNWLTQGPKVKFFEKKFANFLNSKYAIAVSNGTSALDIAYKALNIRDGDEVILPALSYFSTASMISYQNAIPVFVDIKKTDFNIDPKKIEKAITKKTKAISYIDYGGNPADFKGIKKIAKKYNLKIVKDSAQSIGSKYKNKSLMTEGDISTTSFHMAKIISTVEGGMIFTNNKKIFNQAYIRRSHGEKKAGSYIHNVLAQNARMTDIQASIGLVQLKKLGRYLKSRKEIANTYDKYLKKNPKIKILSRRKNFTNSYFFYPILVNNRDKIMKILREKYGIDTRVAYKLPLYRQKLYKNSLERFKKFNCPVAEEISSKIINLPIYPSLKKKEIIYIANSINKILE